jgi:hypothetical protein
MEGRRLQPRLKGRIEEDDEGQQSWYQLYITSFNSPGGGGTILPRPESRSATVSVVSSESDLSNPEHALLQRPGT